MELEQNPHKNGTIAKKIGEVSRLSSRISLITQCARDDSNVRPLVSETNALSNLSYGRADSF